MKLSGFCVLERCFGGGTGNLCAPSAWRRSPPWVLFRQPSYCGTHTFCVSSPPQNQHEDVKKQLLDLQLQHNSLKLEHRKMLETHNQKYSQLQREKENEVTNLQGECRAGRALGEECDGKLGSKS